ncbi:MAG: outer membrane beta-barrel protein [Acidobacteria bacterium]|nr:outer membrane beta-barrel protein [Acidobacteriota bacterium]MBV9624293.1 outer membrane beta-barrel protein [Acidobacteriota bacterium]
MHLPTLSRAPLLFAATLSVAVLAAITLSAQTSPTNDELKQKIESLEKQLADVKAQLQTGQAVPAPPASTASTPTPSQPAAAQNAVAQGPSASGTPAPTVGSLLGPTTLSGFIDTYYNYNSNQPANLKAGNQLFNPYANQFGLNLIELILDKPPDPNASRTGYHVGLGFGQAMNVVNGSDPAGLGFAQYLKEAYFSYLAPAGKGLQIDVGKFVTPNGAEVIESKDNWNYSRSLLFYYAIPYFHYGARAKYIFSDKYSLTGYLVNGWNNIVATNSGKTYGLSFGWNPSKKVGFSENFMIGPQLPASRFTAPAGTLPDPGGSNSSWRQLWDTVVTYSPSSKLSLMVNGDYGRGDRVLTALLMPSPPVSWYGAAGYVKYAFTSKYSLATRYEYFADPDGFQTAVGGHFQEGTFTFERDLASHIISRLEYRHDFSSQPFFLKGANTLEKSQNTVTGGLVFTFTTAEAK